MLGNELCGSGVAAKITARQYGYDVKKLKKLVLHIYPNSATRPKILAPGGFYDQKWFQEFLQTTGPGVVDGLTHHIYNLGAGMCVYICITMHYVVTFRGRFRI